MKLKDYLYFEKISVTDFAKTVGISRIHMSGIANGYRDAGKVLMKRIQRLTKGKVTEKDFEEEEKSAKKNNLLGKK